MPEEGDNNAFMTNLYRDVGVGVSGNVNNIYHIIINIARIAKSCPKIISSVIEVTSCFY